MIPIPPKELQPRQQRVRNSEGVALHRVDDATWTLEGRYLFVWNGSAWEVGLIVPLGEDVAYAGLGDAVGAVKSMFGIGP